MEQITKFGSSLLKLLLKRCHNLINNLKKIIFLRSTSCTHTKLNNIKSNIMHSNRRKFIKDASLLSAGVISGITGVSASSSSMSAESYRRIIGSNDQNQCWNCWFFK